MDPQSSAPAAAASSARSLAARAWVRWLALGGFALLSSALLWRHMLTSGRKTGFGDWQQFLMIWEASRVAVERYGELPLYNPHDCGGITLWGNPQLQTYSPWFLPVFVLGSDWATKIGVLLHTALGIVGTWLFVRRELSLGRPAAALASVAWACGGFFAWHGAGGHSAFLPFVYVPWLLLAWRRAAADYRYCAAVAGIFALTLGEGGVYPPAFFVLVMAFDAVVRLSDASSRRGVISAGVLSMLVALPLSAFRLMPVRELLADTGGRHVPDNDELGPVMVARMLLQRVAGPWRTEGYEYTWPEYGSYVGPIALLLAVIGLFLVVRRRGDRWIAAGTLLFGLTMLGSLAAWAPFAILRDIPIYDSLRVPSRYVVLASFYLMLAAGVALDALEARLARVRLRPGLDWARAAAPWLIVIVGIADVLYVNGKNANMFSDPPLPTEPPSPDFYLEHPGEYGDRYAHYPQLNVGTQGCYQAFQFEPARTLWWGRRPQTIVQRGEARVRETGRTSNTVTLEVRADEPVRVTLNRNYERHWRVEPVGSVVDASGLLGVELPRGRHVVTLRYEPESVRPAFAATAVGLLLAALVLFLRPSRVERVRQLVRRLVGLRSAEDPPEAPG